MYYWKTGLLVAELRNGSLTEAELKNYYLAASLLYLVGYYLALLMPPENGSALAVEVVGSIVVTILGVNFAFHANGGNAGSRFLDKTISIAFPLLIKVLVASAVLGIALIVIEVAGASRLQQEWLTAISVVVIEICFYWRLVIHIRNANPLLQVG